MTHVHNNNSSKRKENNTCQYSSCSFCPSLNSRSIVQNAFMNIKMMASFSSRLYYSQLALVIFLGQIFQCLYYYSMSTIPYFHHWDLYITSTAQEVLPNGIIMSRMSYSMIFFNLVQITTCFCFFFHGFFCLDKLWSKAKMPSCPTALSTTSEKRKYEMRA